MAPDGGRGELTPAVLCDAVAWLQKERGAHASLFDIIVEGNTLGQAPDAQARRLNEWAAAGATWWLEANWEVEGSVEAYASARLAAGPPRLTP